MASNIEVTMVDRPFLAVADLKIRTNMARAVQDCSSFWTETFRSVLEKLASGPVETYGISQSVNPAKGEFDYWAALPWDLGQVTPEGLRSLDIPGGTCACLKVTDPKLVTGTFNYLYRERLPRHDEYEARRGALL